MQNLGREFTLLVLWPVVFGYVLVRLLEMRMGHEAEAQEDGDWQEVPEKVDG
jgi:hypothetical protein